MAVAHGSQLVPQRKMHELHVVDSMKLTGFVARGDPQGVYTGLRCLDAIYVAAGGKEWVG